MLKKESVIKWTKEAKEYFGEIKKSLTKTLVLINPYFSKEFLVFLFASEHTIAGVWL